MEYKELLKRAREKLPESVKETERFSVPKIKGHIQGNKTVLSNFFQIVDALEREEEHMLKYLLKELATPGEVKKPLLLLGRKMSADGINDKIEEYCKKYVICKQCGKYDTELVRKDRVQQLRCKVCGAHYPVS